MRRHGRRWSRGARRVLPLLALLAGCGELPQKPNVVFILADDLGWRDTSLYGSRFHQTPNIDALAARGMTFSQAYAASPLCSPTRASLLTGQHPARLRFTHAHGHARRARLTVALPPFAAPTERIIEPPSVTRLSLPLVTYAEVLSGAGYATGHFGKWHLGAGPFGPEHQGFDVRLPGGSAPGPPSYVAPYRLPELPAPAGEYLEERMAEEAVRFIRAHRDRPFLLNYWAFSVHVPYQARPERVAAQRARVQPGDPQRSPTMAAMIESLDDSVGRIVQTLDELALLERTIIVFMSDNGGDLYDRADGVPATSNEPLRGGKATAWEGGVRVPLVVVWPSVVEAGSRSDALVSSVDFMPTLLEVLGLPMPSGQVQDGQSFVPALKGGAGRRERVFTYFPYGGLLLWLAGSHPAVSVREGDSKLYRFFADADGLADRHELYDLAADPGEHRDLAVAQPERVAQLDARIDAFLSDTNALLPVANPNYRPHTDGWRAVGTAAHSLEDGSLVLESSGRVPGLLHEFLSLQGLRGGGVGGSFGPGEVELRYRSTATGAGRIEWTVDDEPNFPPGRLVPIALVHDGAWHELRVGLPVEGRWTRLRIVPADGPGRIEFDRIRLRSDEGRVWKRSSTF